MKFAVISCAHTAPEVPNERFDWLGEFYHDQKVDLVIDLGDFYDMGSLCSYDDRYPKAIASQNYEADINHGHEAQERLRNAWKRRKVRRPKFVGFEGNHEHRIKTAIAKNPRYEGPSFGLSFEHLQSYKWYDEYYEYENGGPAIGNYGGVDFAHFFSPTNSLNAIGGIHPAYSIISQRHRSSVCGHSHFRDLHFMDGPGSIGMVVGGFQGAHTSWAGQANSGYWQGTVVMNGVESGRFEPMFVSMKMLEKEYG